MVRTHTATTQQRQVLGWARGESTFGVPLSILLQQAMGHWACSPVAQSLRIMSNVFPELLSPREMKCSALVFKEDVVVMLMSVECASQTVSRSLPMHVGRDAHSACNQREFVESPDGIQLTSLVSPPPRTLLSSRPELTRELVVAVLLPWRSFPYGVLSSVATVDVCLGFACLMFSHRSSRRHPELPTCRVCDDPSHMVVEFRSNERLNWCTKCQTRVESSPQEVRTWFSYGPFASTMG